MNLEQMTDTMKNSATVTEDFMGAAEAVLVSVVGRVACWLTPLPSAVLVSRAAGQVFDLNDRWATVIAAVLELVGLVTSNLWLTAKEWNETKRKSDPEAASLGADGVLLCDRFSSAVGRGIAGRAQQWKSHRADGAAFPNPVRSGCYRTQ
jgi:hypothetical protein